MIEKNQTQELVDRSKHKKAIGVKWVYRTKLNPNGFVNKYKEQIVKGYAQVFGIDFSKTFRPNCQARYHKNVAGSYCIKGLGYTSNGC